MGNFILFLNSQQSTDQLPEPTLVFVKGYFDGLGGTVKNKHAFRPGKGKSFYGT